MRAVDALVVLAILVFGFLGLVIILMIGEMIVAEIGGGDVKKGGDRIWGCIAGGVILSLLAVPVVGGIWMIVAGFTSDSGGLILTGLAIAILVPLGLIWQLARL